MVARRHHVLSRCYLKYFAQHRKRKRDYWLYIFDRKNRKQFQQATDNVSVIRDFNKVEIEGQPADIFEQALAGFESDLAPALERIVQSQSLKNEDDRAYLLNFITLLAIRNPRLREAVRGFHERVARMIVGAALASRDRWEQQVKAAIADGFMDPNVKVDFDEVKKFVEGDQFKIEVPTHRHVQIELKVFDEILPRFFERRWWLMKAPRDSAGFITSDHPVCLMWADRNERRNLAAPGFGMLRTQVIFPISTRLAVVGAFELKQTESEVDEWHVAAINGTIAQFAERQTYARDKNFTYILDPNEEPRKGSELISDERYFKPDENNMVEAKKGK